MSPSESAPLLAAESLPASTKQYSARHRLYAVFLLNFLLFCGQAMVLAPRVQIYEGIICDKFSSEHGNKDAPGDWSCKDTAVQAELAFVLGIEELLTVLLSIQIQC